MTWESDLRSALDQNDVDAIQALLAKPQVKKEFDKTKRNITVVGLLNRAIKRNCSAEVFELLVERTANLNGLDNSGVGAIHTAVLSKSLAKIRFLLNRGAEVELRTPEGETVLHLAAKRKDVAEILRALIAHGAKVSLKNGIGRLPIHEAAEFGHPTNVLILIKAGAYLNSVAVDKKRDNFVTPLHLAVRFRHPETTKVLLQYGANPNEEGRYEKYHGSVFDFAKQMFQMPEHKDSVGEIVAILGHWRRNLKQIRLKYDVGPERRSRSQ
ncbi:hypothetical protein TCAL_01159 [Tigriopus californicus]|uniref:Uncharacterized protein n=1 Tax=Tigriopus californicus TaxID=6832 RepID=A0A553P4P4_TIGCA|nr:hypothetical protein TCAL_01159 [Tigriopus californicus]|eukprot:TCALIF_01159-PA protein Name:"Similar to Ank1 Ankyrin-1 (Mus musculus)" AED:0.06 eAED:0.06 QI:0/-1/0/1/-1/1/1/0/268